MLKGAKRKRIYECRHIDVERDRKIEEMKIFKLVKMIENAKIFNHHEDNIEKNERIQNRAIEKVM